MLLGGQVKIAAGAAPGGVLAGAWFHALRADSCYELAQIFSTALAGKGL